MDLLFEAIQVTVLDLIVGIEIALVLGTIALIVSGIRELEEGAPAEPECEPEVAPAFDFQPWERPRAESDLGDVSGRKAA